MPVSVFTSLQVDSVVSYLVAILLPAFDAIFPVLPSETAIIALGVATAGSTDPRIALLIACAAATSGPRRSAGSSAPQRASERTRGRSGRSTASARSSSSSAASSLAAVRR
jgi:hypothetical protein